MVPSEKVSLLGCFGGGCFNSRERHVFSIRGVGGSIFLLITSEQSGFAIGFLIGVIFLFYWLLIIIAWKFARG